MVFYPEVATGYYIQSVVLYLHMYKYIITRYKKRIAHQRFKDTGHYQ